MNVVAKGLSRKLLQIVVAGVIVFAIVAAAKPECLNKYCRDMEIPFPLGLSEECYLDESFSITCHSEKPMIGNIPVTSISIKNHELHVKVLVAWDCYALNGNSHINGGEAMDNFSFALELEGQFIVSNKKNSFTVLGCDTSGFLRGFQNGEVHLIRCSSECPSLSNVVNGSCSDVGCCGVGFPDGLKNVSVQVKSFHNHSKVWNFNPCGYAFVAEKGKFHLSAGYLKKLPNQRVPLVLDWSVGNHACKKAQNQ